jgi:4-alpha-glucanotransferase
MVVSGAPPDMLNLKGQDWGLTTYRPATLVERNFESFRQMLRANMRYAGALRLDHVLWLNRVFLIPHGVKPVDGAYVRYPLSSLLDVLAEESHANGCVVIGEDLGTVPPELRTALREWGVWTYHVMLFERGADGAFKNEKEYQPRSLTTFTTHDLPPLTEATSTAVVWRT